MDYQRIGVITHQMMQLFDFTKQDISLHIKNILSEGELEESTVKDFLTVRKDSNRKMS